MFDKLDDMLIHYEELMRMINWMICWCALRSFSMSLENRE